MQKIEYSICILCMDQHVITVKCLESLVQVSEFEKPTEIIIVDNGSTDHTVPWLLEFQRRYNSKDLQITVLLNPNNRGCTGGRNQAIELATGKYVIILDNDVEIVQSDWLKKLHNCYEKEKNAGIIGPKRVFADNPLIIQQIGFGISKNGNLGYLGRGETINSEKYSMKMELQGYPAACWFLPRDLFVKYGGFDEVYYPVNYEDADFCYRIREQGYRILYCPDVLMYHHEQITTLNSENLQIRHITLKIGKIFKSRWKHMYSIEQGIEQEDIFWGDVERLKKYE